MSTSEGVQYIGGYDACEGCLVHWGDIMMRVGISRVHQGMFSTSGFSIHRGFQYIGVFNTN